MNELLKTIGISLVISVIVVLAFSGSARQTFGTIGAGITNLSGLSITGIPGTFDVSSKATMNGSVVLTPTNGCIQLNGTGRSEEHTSELQSH